MLNVLSFVHQDLREGFEAEAAATGQERLILSAAVAAGYDKVEAGYDVPQINRYLDYINLMSYDLRGAWDSFVGHNSPLFGAIDRTGNTDTLSVSAVTMNWVNRGASREKLLVGLPTYGRVFRLSDPTDTEPFAPASGAGTRGTYTREAGFLSYYEICTLINQGGYTTKRDTNALVPYAYSGDQWISYDDIESLRTKMTWMNDNGFGGAMVWAVELDDFPYNGSPLCGQGPYPLLTAISRCLMDGVQCAPEGPMPTTPVPPPTSPTPVPVTTPTTQQPTTPVVVTSPSTSKQQQTTYCPSLLIVLTSVTLLEIAVHGYVGLC
ncbi:hypothetical protein BaRGS_00030950 [Batillaria attramentaria]|uniref:GH18 domain-containing protein n=1 Tax=Batillaria attramentaria TaxID=370345 RepID=A0ABD0JT62_9CAEN